MSSNKTISQIGQSLTTPSDRTLVEVELNGQSYKMELGALAGFLANRTPSTPQVATPYWVNFPTYVLDAQAQSVAVDAGGRYHKDGAEVNAAARTLSFASIQTAGQSRFDAVVYNLNSQQYELVVGQEGAQPTTPAVDARFNLRVTYILVNDEGGQLQTPPNDHVQNTDTKLDEGGANEVTAAELRALADNPPVSNAIETVISYFGITEFMDRYADAVSVERIEKSAEIDTLTYSTDGGSSYTPIAFPFTGNFSLVAGTSVLWKITYAPNESRGVINVFGQKTI